MYKKQMKFQRLICFALLAASALVFVYSLGLVTDLYDAFYSTMRDPNNINNTKVEGSQIYYHIQPFNHSLTIAALILIGCSILLFVTNNHSRRKYYLANYISTGISAAANIGISVWAIINILKYRNQFLTTVDFEALKVYAEQWGTLYTESTFWFDIAFLVFGILLAFTALSIFNSIWKAQLMKAERQILADGEEATEI